MKGRLILGIKPEEPIFIGEEIKVTLLNRVSGQGAGRRIAIEAPRGMRIERGKVREKKLRKLD